MHRSTTWPTKGRQIVRKRKIQTLYGFIELAHYGLRYKHQRGDAPKPSVSASMSSFTAQRDRIPGSPALRHHRGRAAPEGARGEYDGAPSASALG